MDGSLFFTEYDTEKSELFRREATFKLFGFDLVRSSIDETARDIATWANYGQRRRIAFINAHCVNVAARDPKYKKSLDTAQMLLPDGSGVKIASKICGEKMGHNLNGTDLFIPLCQQAARLGVPIYLLGAKPDIAKKVAKSVQKEVPSIKVAGFRDGFFTKDEEKSVIAEINQSGAGILFVARGVPLQDCWLAENQHRISIPVVLGVGGLFDFFSGNVPRAPKIMRKVGMEWLYRLYQEPVRLFTRYILGNPEFLCRALMSAFSLRAGQAKSNISRFTKRVVDIVGAGLGMIMLAPLLLMIAALIKFDSKGPVLFSQTRIGMDGTPFQIFKFRSMVIDAEDLKQKLRKVNERGSDTSFKMKNDPRITWIGRILRRLSLDELPQLINIIRGDMSIVGPRPPLPDEVANYDKYAMRRLEGKPGLTCIWQVSGRADISFEGQVEMDIHYLKKQSLWLDLKLILLTIPAVLTGRGAY